MVNYANGKIYKMVNNVDDEIYVGSTCNPLYKRKSDHKSNAKTRPNQPNYRHWNTIGWGNVDIVLIENYPCTTKDELHRRERHWIDELKPSLNRKVPTRTHQEYRKREEYKAHRRAYFANNEDQAQKARTRASEYYRKNRETILAKPMSPEQMLAARKRANDWHHKK